MALTLKLTLLVFVLLVSSVLWTVAFAAFMLARTEAHAAGLAALLGEPLYGLFLVAILGIEVRSLTDETFPQVGHDGSDPLCVDALAGVDPVLRRRSLGDGQQRRLCR